MFRPELEVPENKSLDLSNMRWAFAKEEKYAIRWFNTNGFSGKLIGQYLSKTKFEVEKNGVTDIFELPQGLPAIDIKAYMEQYAKSFEMKCELQVLREQVKSKRSADVDHAE